MSYQTVSRVINNSPNVATKTRNRVLRVMRELDYRPNRAAQMLSTRRSHIIEVVTIDIYSLSSNIIAAMATMAQRLGFQITISTVTTDEFIQVVSSTSSRLVDGLIISGQRLDLDDEELLELLRDTPCVKIASEIGTRIATVSYDQHYGARIAVQHLIDLGHRQIAEISGILDIYDGMARHQSWLATLQAAGLQPGPSLPGGFTDEGGYQSMLALLDSGQRFTAVFAANDNMAHGAMCALRDRGLRVPEDMSVVGYDDIHAARFFAPPLTTVRQDHGLIGQLSVEHLVTFIQKADTPIHQRVLMPELVIRESTRQLE